MRFDWLVVGAGLSGATMAERIATQLGQTVLVIDRRPHVAGNAYDELDEAGIRVHRYGAHIFHTNSERVWEYLSTFTTWVPYTHRVRGQVGRAVVPIPFNLVSLYNLMPDEAEGFEEKLLAYVGPEKSISVLALLEHHDASLRQLGTYVYEHVFCGYTVKQWGLRPEQIDRAVTGRVPIVVSRQDRYFRDKYQGIPADGYTAMVERILDHPLIDVETGLEFRDASHRVRYDRLVFTGQIDEFFGFVHGPLPYRSLRFENEVLPIDRHQPVAVMNYPGEVPYTRVIEHAHFTDQHIGRSTVTYEFPEPYARNSNEPYYPLPTPHSRVRYQRYAKTALELRGQAIFSGRLAEYRYYDMDQAVSHALAKFTREIVGRSSGQSTAYAAPGR